MTKRVHKRRPSSLLPVEGFPIKSFGPVGKCIYCGASRYNEQESKLHKEHIIPWALDGQLILQQASCQACERITNSFEQPLLRGIFLPLRHAMNFPSRKRGRSAADTVPWKTKTGEIIQIPVNAYPFFAVLPNFPPCDLLAKATDIPQPRAWLLHVTDFHKRIKRTQIESGIVSWSSEHYFRFLAKIAHSYAVAKFGQYFNPTLISIIRGDSKDYNEYIGGIGSGIAPSRSLWELAPTIRLVDDVPHLVIYIRLFGSYGIPPYEVVAGTFSEVRAE